MKLGVIARCDPRGLAIQSLEVCRHLHPERILLVEPRPAGWPQHRVWYEAMPFTDVVWHNGQFREQTVRSWLDGLDVVYSPETFYDPRFPGWCRAAGVTPVRHANPEQLAADEVHDGDGTVWWAATNWRLEHLPAGTRVVPMPVPLDRFPPINPRNPDKPVRFLHSIGHQAQDDRAGSKCVSRAVQRVREPCELLVRCQDRRMESNFRLAGRVAVTVNNLGIADYWRGYDDCDVLISPRRYGGLSLPSLEAMAAGLALVMTDCSPNETWPGPKVPVVRRRETQMRCGQVEVCDANPNVLADIMSDLARDPVRLAGLQAEARRWAEANSWEALTPLWTAELERAYLSSSHGRRTAARTVRQRGGGSAASTANTIPAGR